MCMCLCVYGMHVCMFVYIHQVGVCRLEEGVRSPGEELQEIGTHQMWMLETKLPLILRRNSKHS